MASGLETSSKDEAFIDRYALILTYLVLPIDGLGVFQVLKVLDGARFCGYGDILI